MTQFGSRSDLPAVRKNISGTLSWLLVNLDGTVDMRPNEMDFIFLNGTVREITQGILVLDQRIRKSVAEVQGSNPFSPGWGSVIAEFVGRKILSTATLREIGQSVANMLETMIALQNEVQDRLELEPSELIARVDSVVVTADGTTISVRVRVITKAKTVEEILLPGAIDLSPDLTSVAA